MIMTNIFLIALLLYPWPIRRFSNAHSVSATLGDARGRVDKPRFHRGIDIPAINGTDVFSITSGFAESDGSVGSSAHVRIDNFWYIHVTNRIPDSTYVLGILDTVDTSPIRVADVRDYGDPGPDDDHLHFQIGPPGGPFHNPLSFDGGPVGFTDAGNPNILSIDFWRQGSEGKEAFPIESVMYGKIDIRACCQDIQTSGGSNQTSGIYRLQWLVRNRDTEDCFGPIQPLIFFQVEPPHNGSQVLLAYDRHGYQGESPFQYWVTNSLDLYLKIVDRYWNTKQKKGYLWNESARIYSEAQFPDGEYRVWVMAYDISKNGGDTLTNPPVGARFQDVTIDNFIPYVEAVEVKQDDCWQQIRYAAHWAAPINENYLGGLIENDPITPNFCYMGKAITFKIIFSETMNRNIMPVLELETSGAQKKIQGGAWLNDTTFEAKTNDEFLERTDEGLATLCISFARDLMGNELDGYPNTISYRNNQGHPIQNEPPPDNHYRFWINPPPQIVSSSPPWVEDDGEEKEGGGEGDTADVDIYKEIKLVFNRPMDTTSVRKSIEIKNVDNGSYANIEEMEWTGENTTVTVRAYDPTVANDTTGFAFHTTYEMTIFGTAEDTSGMTLDGDEDGKSEGSPEDDVLIRFTTRDPNFDVEVKPWISKIKVLESKTLEVKTTNMEETRGIRVSFRNEFPLDPNWGVSAVLPESVYIPAQEISLESHFIGKMGSG